jgi:hypothetical protein
VDCTILWCRLRVPRMYAVLCCISSCTEGCLDIYTPWPRPHRHDTRLRIYVSKRRQTAYITNNRVAGGALPCSSFSTTGTAQLYPDWALSWHLLGQNTQGSLCLSGQIPYLGSHHTWVTSTTQALSRNVRLRYALLCMPACPAMLKLPALIHKG